MTKVDIITAPKRKYIDWQKLEAEFIANEEYPLVNTWLREVKHWPNRQLRAGNTIRHVENWGKKRAETRRKIYEKRMQKARESLEFLMPDIIEAKKDIILKYLDLLKNGHERSAYNTELDEVRVWREPLSLRDRSHILTKLKTELGEPAVITKNKNEDVVTFDTVESLLEAYGIKSDGELNLDDSIRPDIKSQG